MTVKKALITGITGMVGSHLCDYLFDNTDWDIYGLVRWRSSLENIERHLHLINLKKRIFIQYGDLQDSESIIKIIKSTKPDYIFHLAAQSFPKTSFDSPINTFDININGTTRLLDAIKNYSPNSIVHVCSSSEVFGRVDKSRLPIKEEENFHPASPYAISKAGTDLVGRFYAEAYGLNINTTRMFTHTGPRRGDVFAESTFAKQIAMIENNLIEPKIQVGNLDSLRTWSDVRDAVRAYHMLLTINPTSGSYYNIGGNYTCTVGETLKKLISLSTYRNEIEIVISQDRLRPIDADLQIPDISKFYNHTKWKPEISYEKTMLDLLNYWRNKIKSGKQFLVR